MLVSADGTEIYANAVGDPSKQAIVFIHGFAWSLMAFDDIFDDPQWTSQMYLVMYDVRGHGRSGKPDRDEAWESKRFAEDFDTVLEAFELKRPFVAGWSLGAAHLMDILSFHHFNYLAGIINIAGVTYLYDTFLQDLGTPLANHLVAQVSQSKTVEEYQQGAIDFIDACCRALPYEVRQRCLGSIMTQPRKALVRSVTREQNPGVFHEVGNLPTPCLLIYGEKDEFLNERLPECYREWRNFSVEVVEGGSHVPWSKTDERAAKMFSEKMLRWMKGVMKSAIGNEASQM
ncbi:AB hydrolase superfamily protein YdjP [Leucoagaricus sp. SymC.cos]|nr:AB hydrolase superfamily protein YdjP [Leucoagaricus sp. SymC.cos]